MKREPSSRPRLGSPILLTSIISCKNCSRSYSRSISNSNVGCSNRGKTTCSSRISSCRIRNESGSSIYHHHHVALLAPISLTLSRHPSLSSIAPERSSCISKELLYIGSSWSSYLCSSMWRGPQEYIACSNSSKSKSSITSSCSISRESSIVLKLRVEVTVAIAVKAVVLEILGVWIIPLLPLLPSSLWLRVVVPVRVLSMGQIDRFKNDWYLIGASEKKLLRNCYTKKIHKRTINAIPESLGIK